jgi:hypothetical protein
MTFEMLYYLAVYWRIVKRNDFPALYNRIRAQKVSPRVWSPDAVRTISAHLDNVCAFLPVQAACLLRSAVLTTVLRRRGMPAELVFGATRQPFKGHAWVELNGEVINDKPYIHDMYAVWDRI